MATWEELSRGDEKLTPEQAQMLAKQWGYSGVSDAYTGMRDAVKGAGKGTYTPGKYGVYVGNPMGAFAEGFGNSYSSGMQLAEALRARDELGGLGGTGAGNATSPSVSSMNDATTYAAKPPAQFNGRQLVQHPTTGQMVDPATLTPEELQYVNSMGQ